MPSNASSGGKTREEIAQWLDDKTEKEQSAGSSGADIVELSIADDDQENKNVEINTGILKTWALKNIAVGQKQGQSYKLLESVGLTSGDSFQIYNPATGEGFQSVQGYVKDDEIKAKIVNAEAYKEEGDKLTIKNTPFTQTELNAIPAAVEQVKKEQAKAETPERTSETPASEGTTPTTPETPAPKGTTTAGTGFDLNEVVKIMINGNPANYKFGDIVAGVSNLTINDILTLMRGEAMSEHGTEMTINYQIPTDVLQKALVAILTDPEKQDNFIDQFTTTEQVKALREFLETENFNVVLNSLPEAQQTRIGLLLNEFAVVLVKASINGAFIPKKVTFAWIASKLTTLDPAELAKLLKGQEASFLKNSGSGTYKIKIDSKHLKAALSIIAKDPAELAKLTGNLTNLDEFNAFIKFIGKDPKAARQLLAQLEPKEIMRILRGSDDLGELAKILKVKDAKEIWGKLAGLDGKNLRTFLETADGTGETLFKKLNLGTSIDEAFNKVKNIPMPEPSSSFRKSPPITFTNTDWPKEIYLADPNGKWIQPGTLNAKGLKQLLLNLDKTQVEQFFLAKGSKEVTDLLLKLKPEEIAEILSKPDFINSLSSAKFSNGASTSSLNELATALKSKPENLAQILNKLEPDLLNNFLRPLETDLREQLLLSIKGLKNSPLNQILGKLGDVQLKSLLNLKNRSGQELFKALGSGATAKVNDVLNAIKPSPTTTMLDDVLNGLKGVAKGVKNIGFLKTIGKILKPAMPILQKVAKAIPFLAPLIDFITGRLEGETVAQSAAGTIGSFAGGWAGGALGAMAGASVAASATAAIAVSSFGFLVPLAIPIGGILGATVTLFGAIAGSAGGGWIGDRLYELVEGFLKEKQS